MVAHMELEGEYACRIAFSQRCNDGTEQVQETRKETPEWKVGRGRENEGGSKIDRKSKAKVGETKKSRRGRWSPRGRRQHLTGDVECQGLKGSRGGAPDCSEPDGDWQTISGFKHGFPQRTRKEGEISQYEERGVKHTEEDKRVEVRGGEMRR